jgi:hypothetical protein
MKSDVRTFKSLKDCLGQCEPFIRDPRILYIGNKIERFAWMLPREIWGNWILAAICSEGREHEFRITTDPDGGDGVIWDPATEVGWRMEHILLPVSRPGDTRSTDQRIIDAANKKQTKGGAQYARGKTLVILNESSTGERWHPTVVAQNLPDNDFVETWVIGPDSFDHASVTYAATKLELDRGQAPVFKVHINSLFTRWRVEQIQ